MAPPETSFLENDVTATSEAHAKAIELCKHSVRMTTAAGSGHPSSALALGHIVFELMYRQMQYDPADPWNPNNDRLVLSVGHAVPIVYAAYADLGGAVGTDESSKSPLTVDHLSTLRELNSVLDGHPNPAEGFPFFDAATGSLGQGLSVAAGLALAAQLNGIEKRIFAIVGDGEAREGQVWEAMDFIVDHGLSNVCVVFSCNGHGQADSVSPQQSADNMVRKAAAFGWKTEAIDGHCPDAIGKALEVFNRDGGPLAIVAKTVKGWGCEMMLGKNFHGKPVPAADVDQACSQLDDTGARLGAAGNGSIRPSPRPRSSDASPPKSISLPPLEQALNEFGMSATLEKKKLATRAGYGVALAALGGADERIIALDADVSNSTYSDRFARMYPDRFIECKIAEQNMISVGAGLSAAGKIPFASSFAKFIARAVDQIDMAAISRANLNIVGSHSGVSLAADGPSQMAVSDMAYFRSLTKADSSLGGKLGCVFHPSDAVSAYRCAELMANTPGICYMRTHRPEAPFLYPLDEQFGESGFKQLREGKDMLLVSSGYMVYTTLAVAESLGKDGIDCGVLDVYRLPFDIDGFLSAARAASGLVLSVEDNYVGGVHAELAEAAALAGDVRVRGMTCNRVPKSAKRAEEVFAYVGVDHDSIVTAAREETRR
ncbi:MAG: transketolase [Planctomycetota bacterium]|jgi:transketolase